MNSSLIHSILLKLGFPLIDRGDYWHSSAVFRGGDNPHAVQIYKDSGVWKDYVAGDSFLPFGKLVELTVGLEKSKTLLEGLVSDLDQVSTSNTPSPEETISQEKIFPDQEQKNLLPHYSFYKNRGISEEFLSLLKSGLCTSGSMYQRYVFPIYNKNQQIHGFAGRDMLAKNNRPKWKHMGKKTNWVYPLYMKSNDSDSPFFSSILESKEVFIVESIGDMLALLQQGFFNVLVTFGLDISPKLKSVLMGLNLSKIWLSLNNDQSKSFNAGQFAAVKNLLNLSSSFNLSTLNICLPIRSDFGDMSKDDFSKWLKKLEFNRNNHKFIIEKAIESAKKFRSAGKLSKNAYENIKYLK